MTSGANPRSGGTSMDGQGVLAMTGRLITPLAGSSLLICRLQLLGPQEVGVNRIVSERHESGLTTAGKGLLIRVKSAQGGTKDTLVTLRLHLPTLQIAMAFSVTGPAHPLPKSVEPVTRMLPGS